MCNCLKSNSNKCHVLVSTKKSINTGDYRIDNSEFEKLLSRKVGVNLHFNDHISDLLKKDIDISCSHSFCGIKQKLIIN